MAIKHRNKIILGIGLGMFVALIVAGYHPRAHFFSGLKGKTAWDWLSLAGVPLSVAGLGFWLQTEQYKRNEEQLQEEILQNYYDKVSALLVDKNLLAISAKRKIHVLDTRSDAATPEEEELLDVSMDVIRARTLATLQRLNGSRKGSLIRFLAEAEVISRLKLSLKSANLEEADLSHANLKEADLSHANLKWVNLSHANLKWVNLSHANLKEADLSRANLKEADLSRANLKWVNLSDANLEGSGLRHTRLRSAFLLGAVGLTKEQLEGENPPYLCDTKLPKGIDIDPNRDCERLELVERLERLNRQVTRLITFFRE